MTSTSYVCNGDDGGSGSGGLNSLVQTSEETAGQNCPFGGTKIETGLDADDDGVLDPSEVNAAATSYVCHIAPNGALSPSTGIVAAIKPNGVSTTAGAPITVRFTLKDDRGFPIDLAGAYSINTPVQPRFSLSYFSQTNVNSGTTLTPVVGPLVTFTKTTTAPTMYNPASANSGTLVENGFGAGDYTYTFPTAPQATGNQPVAYDTTKMDQTHVVWIQATRQTDLIYQGNANTFYADNKPYYYVPDGSHAPQKREIAAQSGCDSCHGKFKAETTTSATFHGGGRVNVGMCNVCHSPARTSNPAADSITFVHRIHNGEEVATANLFHGIAATYPQDIRQCGTCHNNAEQGSQYASNPTIQACTGCHDYVQTGLVGGVLTLTATAAPPCGVNDTLARGSDGKPLPCDHGGGVADNTQCATCHGANAAFSAVNYHKPVIPPDPNNAWNGGTNNMTNASYVAAGGYLPPGADRITYDVKSVDVVADAITPSIKRPQITFKLKRNGMDVVFPAPGPGAELMPNFVGSPSVYFAFAIPQDGNPTPSDFNASASGYIKKILDGTASGTGAGSISAPDSSGYYKITLTGVVIPSTAKMVTGGIGYTYALSGTAPLVQTNVSPYTWVPSGNNDGKAQGGLSVPAPNVWKVATGYTGRRQIVDNAKCQACHSTLGVAPSFHAGQRNDGPSCSWCHTANRSSAGWAASSKYFIHAIHAGRKRTVNYTWHAVEKGPGYDEIEFPGTLNVCTTCHVPNTYDFTNATNLAALANEPLTTVASGTINADPLTNSTYYTISPYVGTGTYGSNYAYDAAAGTNNEALTQANLVATPITAACVACHDSSIAIDHMKGNGGQFYAPRSSVLANTAKEQCVVCHGPGRVSAIGLVHQH